MKIALAQIDYHIGNFELNEQKIISAIKNAKAKNVDLVIFSELAVCGYNPMDLLYNEDFIDNCNDSILNIAEETKGIAAIVGCPTLDEVNGRLYNSAYFIINGEVHNVFDKSQLLNCDIANEPRYFAQNDDFEVLEINDTKIALTISHDLWDQNSLLDKDDEEFSFKDSPMEILSQFAPEFIINISAIPFNCNKPYRRLEILAENCKHFGMPAVFVNQVGANDNIIYDGGSVVMNKNGEILASAKYFEEDFVIYDTKDFNKQGEALNTKFDKTALIYSALTLGIKDYFQKMGFKKAVLGLSGGIDSAVVLALAVLALGKENVHSILMPTCYSTSHSVDDSLEMVKRTQSSYSIVPIENLRKEFENTMSEVFAGTKQGLAEENIQARLRGSILMAYSNKFGNILLNTSNKSEESVGYSTLYGDMNGSLSILGDVYKTDVYNLARYINKYFGDIIPENIITKAPSAELRPDQKDQDSLPPYDILDAVLYGLIEEGKTEREILEMGYDPETVKFIIKLLNRAEYKRFQAPPILKVSTKSFGSGRIIPLVAKY